MLEEIEIRESQKEDWTSLEKLYPDAFPDEELRPLVRVLIQDDMTALSLVAMTEQTVAGHVIFTHCSVAGNLDKGALLGPLVVSPALQKQGIGTALVRDGFERLVMAGINQVYVLGDPAYYQQFGFEPETDVSPPYPLADAWRAAWQSVNLQNPDRSIAGTLSVSQPWLQPALWMP